MNDQQAPGRANFIASPLALRMLDLFGVLVYEAVDPVGVFMVGSALTRRDWRDVDVRAILFDHDFAARFGDETDWRRNRSLAAHNYAFSALGKEVTKLPIDFQIEQMTAANGENPDGGRHPLGHQLIPDGCRELLRLTREALEPVAARVPVPVERPDEPTGPELSCPACGYRCHWPICTKCKDAYSARSLVDACSSTRTTRRGGRRPIG